MAKRYHQSKKDRRDESRGMKSGFIFHAYQEPYSGGMEARRKQEMEDAGMIREDHNAVANLPQGVIMRPYPKTGPYLPEGIDDTISGIDRQMDFDDSQRSKHFYPKKV